MKRRTFVQSSIALVSGSLLRRHAWAAGRVWDIIVVGAGTAGLPAALAAAGRGASVLLVDAADEVGGTLHLAGGEISAAGSKLQKARGIVDSPDIHYEDIMRLTHGLADPDICRTTVDNAADTIDWLLDRGLVPLPEHPVTGETPGRPGYSVPRYLWDKDHGPAVLRVLVGELEREMAHGRIVTQLGTRVSRLLTNDAGDVEGVSGEVDGQQLDFRCRHVILTTGGYAMNPALFEMLTGHPAYAAGSYPHSMGDGLRLATSVGGWLRGQHLHRAGTGKILSGDKFGAESYARFETTPQVRQPWEIWINNHGRRFIREDEPDVHLRNKAVLDQPRLKYAIVFDRETFARAPVGIAGWSREKLLAHFDTHPMFASAGSLDELAAKLKVDPAGLVATVAEYNGAVASSRDALGRSYMPLPVAEPPFYGIVHLGSSVTSSTGVVVDTSLRVLRGDGDPVPNLYAAGEVLGSGTTLGDAFAPGMMITPAMTLGRLLGERLPV